MKQDLPANLRLLCSYLGPVADVCRRLGINRQQFNKYLSGQSRPSASNMRRICDFFGVEEFELLLPADRFQAMIRLRPPITREADPMLGPMRSILDADANQPAMLSKYTGYYYKYFYSFSRPGLVLRSLVKIFPNQTGVYYKTVERLKVPGQAVPTSFTFKYAGRFFRVGMRLHMLDHETIVGNEVSHTILFPASLNRVSALCGVMVGVSGTETHEPVAARTVLTYLGPTVRLREALGACALYAPASGVVPAEILAYIANDLRNGQKTLRADAERLEL